MPFDHESYDEGMKKLAEMAARTFREWAQQARHKQAAMAFQEAADYIEKAGGAKPFAGNWK